MKHFILLALMVALLLPSAAVFLTFGNDADTTYVLAKNKDWFLANVTIQTGNGTTPAINVFESNPASESSNGTWNFLARAFDDDFTTFGFATLANAAVWFNHPNTANQTAYWQIAGGSGEFSLNNATNYTIMTACMGSTSVSLLVIYLLTPNNMNWFCQAANGTYMNVTTTAGNRIYEEGWYYTQTAAVTGNGTLSTAIFTMNNSNFTMFDPTLLLAYNFENYSLLGENDTRVVDISGNQRNGTVIGGNATTPNGKYGGAMQFKSSNPPQYVRTPNMTGTAPVNWTISMWVKPYQFMTNAKSNTIFTESGNVQWMLAFDNTSLAYYDFNNAWIENLTARYEPNTWLYVVVSRNLSTIRGYVNGVFNFQTIDPINYGFRTTVQFGSRSDSYFNQYDFNGSIDEVRVWKRSLSNEEIIQQYKSNIRKFESAKYTFINNQTNLTEWNYTYSLWTNDSTLAVNQTPVQIIKFNEPIQITNCSAGSNSSTPMEWTFTRDISNGAYTTSLYRNNFTIGSQDGSTRVYYFTNTTTNESFCIYPSWANGSLYSAISFEKAGFVNGTYIITGYANNQTNNATLWLRNGDLTVIYVADMANTRLTGAQVDIYQTTDLFGTIKIGSIITDAEGKNVFYLTPYKDAHTFKIFYENQSTNVPNIIITCTAGTCPPYILDLRLLTVDPSDYFKLLGKLSSSCDVNASNWLVCSVNDSSGLVRTMELIVERKGGLVYNQTCYDVCTSSQCILECNLGNTTGAIYRHVIQIYGSPKEVIDSKIWDFTTRLINFGSMGLLIGLFLILILFFAGAWNPTVALLLTYFGLIIGYIIGLLPIGWDALVGMGFVVGIIIWKMGL